MISPPSGTGYLGGDSPNIVSRNGTPFVTTIDLYFNSEWCGTTQSFSDGTWRFSNLDMDSVFDIIARGGDILDDVISSRRAPYAMPVVVDGGPLLDLGTIPLGNSVDVTKSITGTPGPYSVSIVSGPEDSGINFSIDDDNLIVSGAISSEGVSNFTLKISTPITTDYCLIDVKIIFSYTKSLLHFDKIDGFSLSDLYGESWVLSDVTNGSTISHNNKKFGSGSFFFNSSYLQAYPDPINLPSDFTIELWVYSTTIGESGKYQTLSIYNNTYGLYLKDGCVVLYDASDRITSNSYPLNEWFHVALCRISGEIRLYLNGIDQVSVRNDSSSWNINQIGGHENLNEFFSGYIDEFRITSGISRYTSDFTPPTAPFTY